MAVQGWIVKHPVPLLFRVVGAISGSAMGYHEPSATDARRRIISFFDTHLKSQESSDTGANA